MLYVVQVVSSGVAAPPRLFLDETRAQEAFVQSAREYWPLTYPQYCEQNELCPESFAAAEAFARTFDAGGGNLVHFWRIVPEDMEQDKAYPLSMNPAQFQQRRQQVVQAAQAMEQDSRSALGELQGLLQKIAGLTTGVEQLDAMLTGSPKDPVAAQEYRAAKVEEPAGKLSSEPAVLNTAKLAEKALQEEESAAPSLPDMGSPFPNAAPAWIPSAFAAKEPAPSQPVEAPPVEKTETPEWGKMVMEISGQIGGMRNEHKYFTKQDWRHDIYSNLTSLEYLDWVAVKVDQCITEAKQVGYSLERDLNEFGRFFFQTPAGQQSAKSYGSETTAWCEAFLHNRSEDEEK
ncbi:MAG: hypothetical protein P8X63_02070 [Desulfuromonadaceae bacterium]